MLHRSLVKGLVLASSLLLGGCYVRSQPGYYGSYGYTSVATPSNVYYSGGYYNNSYYAPGYYQRSAPFMRGYVAPRVYAPAYAAPPAQVGVRGTMYAPGIGGVAPRVGISVH